MMGGYSIEKCADCQQEICGKHIEWEDGAWRCKRCIRNNAKKAKAT